MNTDTTNELLKRALLHDDALLADIPQECLDPLQWRLVQTWWEQKREFDPNLKSVVRQLLDELNPDERQALTQIIGQIKKARDIDQATEQYLLSQSRTWAQFRLYRLLGQLDQSSPTADKDADEIMDRIHELKELKENQLQQPINARHYQLIEKAEQEEIRIGIDWLMENDVTIKKKVLYSFIATTNGGKTIIKTYFASQLVKAGRNVLWLAMEEPYQDTIRRIWQSALNIDEQEFKQLTEDGYELLGQRYVAMAEEKGWGQFLVVEWTGKDTQFIGNWIKKYNKQNEQPIDAVIVDYAKLLGIKDDRRNQQEWERVGKIFVGLKQLAMQHNLAIFTSIQLNREASQALIQRGRQPDLADVSGAFEATHHANYIWSVVLTNVQDDTVGPNRVLGRFVLTVLKQKYGRLRTGDRMTFDWTADHLLSENRAHNQLTIDDNMGLN
jgi:hypothetical protein